MKQIIYCLLIVLATACEDCECRVESGSANFSVRTSYSFVQDPNNIFLKDTAMSYYFVTVKENGIVKEFAGQCDHNKMNSYGNRYIVWAYGATGEETDNFTHSALDRCLKMALWQEVRTQQRIGDIKSMLEDQN